MREGYKLFELGIDSFYVEEKYYSEMREIIDEIITLAKLIGYELNIRKMNEYELYHFKVCLNIEYKNLASNGVYFSVDDDDCLKVAGFRVIGENHGIDAWNNWTTKYNEIISGLQRMRLGIINK